MSNTATPADAEATTNETTDNKLRSVSPHPRQDLEAAAMDAGKEDAVMPKDCNSLSTPADAVTKHDIGKFTFDEYEKIGTTKLSREVLQAGVKVETLEGEYVCAEPSRLALDVNGNVYPVAESVFRKIYAAPSASPPSAEVQRLMAALGPFAHIADCYRNADDKQYLTVRVGDCRRASAALSASPEPDNVMGLIAGIRRREIDRLNAEFELLRAAPVPADAAKEAIEALKPFAALANEWPESQWAKPALTVSLSHCKRAAAALIHLHAAAVPTPADEGMIQALRAVAELSKKLGGKWSNCRVNRDEMVVCPCVAVFDNGHQRCVLTACLDDEGDPRKKFKDVSVKDRERIRDTLDFVVAARNLFYDFDALLARLTAGGSCTQGADNSDGATCLQNVERSAADAGTRGDGEWVKVGDRLPDEGAGVIGCIVQDGFAPCIFLATYCRLAEDRDPYWCHDLHDPTAKPTHWMPRPQLPAAAASSDGAGDGEKP